MASFLGMGQLSATTHIRAWFLDVHAHLLCPRSLVCEVRALENMLDYAKAQRIQISDSIKTLTQHAYNMKWWLNSVDGYRWVQHAKTDFDCGRASKGGLEQFIGLVRFGALL